ncbi:MAG: NUDIX hydrolase [Pseudomonadota bacterium]
MKEIETLDSRVVYQNKWMTVREDKIRRASGADGIYGVVDKPDFVAILPIDNGFIHLVQQYRYPVGGRYWELPQGSWEENPTADNYTVAKAELREETGLIAGQISHIGHIYQAYGHSNQGFNLFYATALEHTEQQLDHEEEDLITAKFPVTEFESMITSGTIKDATTISAYGYARLKGVV